MRVARTGSTQDVVLRAARDGADEGFCCLAAEQTSGRGRQGREWVAPPGAALLASVLLRRSASVAAGIPFAAGLALVDVLAADYGVTAGLKWPNDVLVDRRKLAGILGEVAPGRSSGEERGPGARSRRQPPRRPVSGRHRRGEPAHPRRAGLRRAEDLLVRWSDALADRIATLERGGIGAILGDWRRCAVGLGEAVSVAGPAAFIEGVAVDVGEDGALLVEASGQTHRFLAGDVHLTTRAG